MTREELEKLSDGEINRLVAEKVMGWLRCEDSLAWCARSRQMAFNWSPSTDYNDAALVRAEVERRDLQVQFSVHLWRLVQPKTQELIDQLKSGFYFANATPRQTCIAALLAVEGVK